jgi:hypothetical protein
MKKFFLLLVSLIISGVLYSQNLVWTSEFGGSETNGAISFYDLMNSINTKVVDLKGNPIVDNDLFLNGQDYDYLDGLSKGSDGYIYAISSNTGGLQTGSQGVLYRMDPNLMKPEILHVFGSSNNPTNLVFSDNELKNNIYNPIYKLFEFPSNSNVFYGFCSKGGANDKGGVYRYDHNTKSYEILDYFDCTNTGCFPTSGFVKGPNNELYFLNGMLSSNSSQIYNGVSLSKIDATTNKIVIVDDMILEPGYDLFAFNGDFVYDQYTNCFYGAARYSVDPSVITGGGIWKHEVATGKTYPLAQVTINEKNLGDQFMGLFRGPDANLYIVARYGGDNNKGSLIKFVSGNLIKVADFNEDVSSGLGIQISGTKMYGMFKEAVNNLVWEYDLNNNTYKEICSTATCGKDMQNMFTIVNGKIIGFTNNIIGKKAGNYFEYDLSSNTSKVFVTNESLLGRNVIGSPIVVGDTVVYYFTSRGGTYASGNYEAGTIMKYSITKNITSKVYDFSSSETYVYKEGNYSLCDNGKIYFTMTKQHGTYKYGISLYELDPVNNNVSNVHSFYPYSIGYNSYLDYHAGITQYSSNKIVMATKDSLWLYDVSNKSVLRAVKSSVSNFMRGNSLVSGNNVYIIEGKDILLPSTDNVDILKYDITNDIFSVFYSFETAVNGVSKDLTEVNGLIYGSTTSGGDKNDGYLFSIDMQTGVKTILYHFDRNSSGAIFEGWTYLNSKLYSTSYKGGTNNVGTLVSFDIQNSVFDVMLNLDLNNGKSYRCKPAIVNGNIVASTISYNVSNKVYLYPNPTQNLFYTNLENVNKIELLNSNGQLLKSIEGANSLSVEEFTSGIYLVKLYSNNQVYTSKIIIN